MGWPAVRWTGKKRKLSGRKDRVRRDEDESQSDSEADRSEFVNVAVSMRAFRKRLKQEQEQERKQRQGLDTDASRTTAGPGGSSERQIKASKQQLEKESPRTKLRQAKEEAIRAQSERVRQRVASLRRDKPVASSIASSVSPSRPSPTPPLPPHRDPILREIQRQLPQTMTTNKENDVRNNECSEPDQVESMRHRDTPPHHQTPERTHGLDENDIDNERAHPLQDMQVKCTQLKTADRLDLLQREISNSHHFLQPKDLPVKGTVDSSTKPEVVGSDSTSASPFSLAPTREATGGSSNQVKKTLQQVKEEIQQAQQVRIHQRVAELQQTKACSVQPQVQEEMVFEPITGANQIPEHDQTKPAQDRTTTSSSETLEELPSTVKEEVRYIDDDPDEDLLFLQALEESERRLESGIESVSQISNGSSLAHVVEGNDHVDRDKVAARECEVVPANATDVGDSQSIPSSAPAVEEGRIQDGATANHSCHSGWSIVQPRKQLSINCFFESTPTIASTDSLRVSSNEKRAADNSIPIVNMKKSSIWDLMPSTTINPSQLQNDHPTGTTQEVSLSTTSPLRHQNKPQPEAGTLEREAPLCVDRSPIKQPEEPNEPTHPNLPECCITKRDEGGNESVQFQPVDTPTEEHPCVSIDVTTPLPDDTSAAEMIKDEPTTSEFTDALQEPHLTCEVSEELSAKDSTSDSVESDDEDVKPTRQERVKMVGDESVDSEDRMTLVDCSSDIKEARDKCETGQCDHQQRDSRLSSDRGENRPRRTGDCDETDYEDIKPQHQSLHDIPTQRPQVSNSHDRVCSGANADTGNDCSDSPARPNAKKRTLTVVESSSGESSDDDETPAPNALEAALRFAKSSSPVKPPKKSISRALNADQSRTNAPPVKKKRALSKQKCKSTRLWPTLDDFYDLILELKPTDMYWTKCLERFRCKYCLPKRYDTVAEYKKTLLDAVVDEVVASIRAELPAAESRMPRRIPGESGNDAFTLASVSSCCDDSSIPSLGASSMRYDTQDVFSESGFSGSNKRGDCVLIFRQRSEREMICGDLVLVKAFRNEKCELSQFGIVLCNSIVAAASSSYKSCGDRGVMEVCILMREPRESRDGSRFTDLIEGCLSNSHQFVWSIGTVYSLVTSAREYQAIKSMSFLKKEQAQVIISGKIGAENTNKQQQKMPLSPSLLKHFRTRYNDSQLDAIEASVTTQKHVLIQGPPGTGKTKTILGILNALLDGAALATKQKGRTVIRVGASLSKSKSNAQKIAADSIRVLVAAPSNAAVDEILVRLLKEGVFSSERNKTYLPRMVRVGRAEGLGGIRGTEVKNQRKISREVEGVLLETCAARHKEAFGSSIKKARQSILKEAQLVFCTLSGAGCAAMCELVQEFDAVVIDEAAQAVEPSSLIPFKFQPERVILVGDHRQLPATIISKNLIDLDYDRSLFQRFVENGSKVFLLKKQYRMHPQIARFPSHHFYGGQLENESRLESWTARAFHKHQFFKPFVFFDVLDGCQSQVNGSTSMRNVNEIEFIIVLLRNLFKTYPNEELRGRIGIVAPYKQQIKELGKRMQILDKEFNTRFRVEINTVDGFQGREKDVIVYSSVRTSGGRVVDMNSTFWADERRLNVAITRAKCSLWMVGNSSLLSRSTAWNALIQDAKQRNVYVPHSDVYRVFKG